MITIFCLHFFYHIASLSISLLLGFYLFQDFIDSALGVPVMDDSANQSAYSADDSAGQEGHPHIAFYEA